LIASNIPAPADALVRLVNHIIVSRADNPEALAEARLFLAGKVARIIFDAATETHS